MISLHALQKQASDYVPHLSEEAHIHRRILEMIDGQASLEHIARQLAAEFPARFARWQQVEELSRPRGGLRLRQDQLTSIV